jgi:hypothetical protein
MSFTSQYAKRKGIIILDEVGESIPSFKKMGNEVDYSSFKPHLPYKIIDKTQVSTVTTDISKTETLRFYSDIERYGYVIVSIRTNKPWQKRQMVEYKLAPVYSIPRDAEVLDHFPSKAYKVRFDPVTRRIRLEGPNVRFKVWLNIKEK